LRWAKEQGQKTTVFINSFKKVATVKKAKTQNFGSWKNTSFICFALFLSAS